MEHWRLDAAAFMRELHRGRRTRVRGRDGRAPLECPEGWRALKGRQRRSGTVALVRDPGGGLQGGRPSSGTSSTVAEDEALNEHLAALEAEFQAVRAATGVPLRSP